MNQKIKILLADDHQIVLDGLESILKDHDDIEIVGKALDGVYALAILERAEVDVAIIDIQMPRKGGLETLKEIKQRFPNTKVLALTMHHDSGRIREMMKEGVNGYILKNRSFSDLIKGIHEVTKGRKYWGSEVSQSMMDSISNPTEPASPSHDIILTEMEIKVLELLAEGHTSKEIADELFRAESTIDTHKKNLKKKLNAKNDKVLVRYAVENGHTKK